MLKLKYLSIALIIPTCCFCSPNNKNQNKEDDTFVFDEVFTAERVEHAKRTVLNYRSFKSSYFFSSEYAENPQQNNTSSQGDYEYDYSIADELYYFGNSTHTEIRNNRPREVSERELVFKTESGTGYERYYQEDNKDVSHTNLTDEEILERYDISNYFYSLYNDTECINSQIYLNIYNLVDDQREFHIKYENDGTFVILVTGFIVYHGSETLYKEYCESDYSIKFNKDFVLERINRPTKTVIVNGEYEFESHCDSFCEEYTFDETIVRKTPENFNQ